MSSTLSTLARTTLALAGILGTAAFAQTAAPVAAEATPDYTLGFNVGAVTDYRFRGISQTRLKPALQGGIDFAHSSGFYVGFWGSTIRILKDIPGGRGPVELDFYGGYKGKINDDFAYDVGVLRYQYPRENFATTPNTTELYGSVTYQIFTVKYSHSVGRETFGVPDSRGSGYLEAAAAFDLGNGFSLTPHVGRQYFRNNGYASYTDYSLALGKDFGNGLSAFVSAVGTNADKSFYASGANGKFLGKTGAVAGIKYTF
jgi:uncharacterized protein (TIGR02001 family)